MKTRTSLLLITFLVFTLPKGYSQIVIVNNPDITAEQLVENIAGEGVQVSNASFEGVTWARGIFTNGNSTNLGIESGIVLTTGSTEIIPDSNWNCGASYSSGITGGWPPPSPLPFCYDPAVLQFDIVPDSDTLKLKYVFGSEEYNEFVGSTFNDFMVIFISGPNPFGGQYSNYNFAFVPGTEIQVAINSINNGNTSCATVPSGPCTNCEYFADNTGGLTLEYDGLTTVLTAWVLVVPCETYHLYLAVADAGDGILDSGLFLEENSLTSSGKEITSKVSLDPPGLTDNLVEGHVNATVVFRLPDASYSPMTVCFDIEGYAINGEDYEEIDNCVSFEEGQDSTSIQIIPLDDQMIEGEETIILIIENTLGCETVYDTLELIIEDYREMEPVTTPNTIICEGQEVLVGVGFNPYWGAGFPPYTYLWEPGGYTEDTITVSPMENTTYVVTITDFFEETAQDSVQITVFPYCNLETFYFEASLNPGLPFDVYGEITGDSVFVAFPAGTNLSALIPSYTFVNEECTDTVGTINDFTNPVIYEFVAPGGCSSHWTVVADIETNLTQNAVDDISIFPNPAKDQITITNANGWKFEMLNTIGKSVLNGPVSAQNQSVDIKSFGPGLYFLKFQKADKVFVKRVVICR